MQFSDDENNAGPAIGTAPIPAADFALRRVATLLGRERPMGDQDDASFRKEKMMLAVHQASKDAYCFWKLPTCEIDVYHLLGKRPAHLTILFGIKKMPRRWLAPANYNSRFLGRPG